MQDGQLGARNAQRDDNAVRRLVAVQACGDLTNEYR
jgi:hypothetical protein